MKSKGIVYLVGAGPGDPGLLTLRGAELLARADAVASDPEISPELLHHLPKTAEVLKPKSPAELVELLIARARAGKTVVRLFSGDPFLFGSGSDEALKLGEAGVPFEIVPGISSFIAAPSYAGVPPTHRDFASQLTLADSRESSDNTELAQIAKSPGTKVFRLGPGGVASLAGKLSSEGLSASTPVAVIFDGTAGNQHSVEGTLGTIGSLVAKEKPAASVVIIGDVVKLRGKLNWFEQRPLFGKRVVVTRAREQAGQLSRQLRERGADVLEVPTIKIEAPTRREDLVDAMLELNSYDWIVFTSPNGVTSFFEYFFRKFHDMRDIGGARIAAVGPATANKLKELHLQVDLMPDEALASKIAEAFSEFESIENLKICLMRAEVANRELPESLEALGAIVDDIACYRTVPETEDPTGSAATLLEEGADWIAFTSSSTVEHFHTRFDLPALLQKFPNLKTATIGPETSKALVVLGLEPTVEAKQHTIEGLVDAITARKS